ncbi:MAG: TrkH family potassium uptake protein [Planctomycetes bacterium]|nr:TrkH family potassium uptake protein [Planctomycetota bacterium]
MWNRIDFAIVAKVLGFFVMAFSLTMVFPLLVGLWRSERFVTADRNTLVGTLAALGVGLVIGFVLWLVGRRSQGEFYRREGILTVALVWLLVGALGAMPFAFSGVLSFADGFFESVSGLTTTGSSVLGSNVTPAIQSMPPSLLFWRSWLHWLGGLGIVVVFLAFLPALGVTEKTLFQAEVAGVSKEGLRPRIRHSTFMLLKIYIVITTILVLTFFLLGMNVFEAVCHAFATIATGGFSTKNYSIGEFNSVAIEVTATIGMFLAATNFGLYHRFVNEFRPMRGERWWKPRWDHFPTPRKLWNVFWQDPEWRFYATMVGAAMVFLTLVLALSGETVNGADGIVRDYEGDWGRCARDATFQTASLVSSTGFANSNLLQWPHLAQATIILLMIVGGCSGSTGGGIKMARALVLLKLIGRSLRRFIRPRSVEPLRIGKEAIDLETADRIVALSACWMVILGLGTLVLIVLEPRLDFVGSFTSMVTALCNMGPAFVLADASGATFHNAIDIGSFGSFGEFSPSSKTFMAFVMILGRLEIYTALIIVMPGFWKD